MLCCHTQATQADGPSLRTTKRHRELEEAIALPILIIFAGIVAYVLLAR